MRLGDHAGRDLDPRPQRRHGHGRTVEAFDTSVQIIGGGDNTITGIRAKDNADVVPLQQQVRRRRRIEPVDCVFGNMIPGNRIASNTVPHNGINEDDGIRIEGPNAAGTTVHAQPDRGDGIVLFGAPSNPSMGEADFSTVEASVVDVHAANGILVESTSNTISSNNTASNAAYPGVTAFDLNDANPDCEANVWSGNLFATSNPPCVG